jgi:uncharacterized membrane protein YfcA
MTEATLTADWGLLALVLGVFVIGGTVKGATGLGLPPIAMGLLVAVMPAASAAAVMVIPVALTNLWQALRGPALGELLRRFWPLLATLALTTALLSRWLLERMGTLGVIAVGAVLVLFASLALSGRRLQAPTQAEPFLGPLIGLLTGAMTAATGIAAVPLLPYLQSLGLSRDLFVQTLGLSFSISSVALGLGLRSHMATLPQWPLLLAAALLGTLLGMVIGEWLRPHLPEALFRRLVLWLLLGLGLMLIVSPL